jgi:hypothetical protein
MAITLIEEETNLSGVVESQIATTDGNGATFTATFYDSKTGLQRTPQSTTLTFLINKDSKRAERIRLASHSTTAGLTTCTIATNGRTLPLFGTGAGTTTGQQHNAGDSIGCVTNHEAISQINDFIDGTSGSSGTGLRVGDGTDSNVRYYAENADANKPYLGYDAATSTWVFSNDGSSSTAIGNGASVYTAGDGLTLTASDFDIDVTDTTIFKNTSAGAGDAAIVPILDASGELDLTFIKTGAGSDYITGASANVTGANLSTLTAGSTSNADALHTHTAPSIALNNVEAIDGSSTPQAVSVGGENFKKMLLINATGETFFLYTSGTMINLGDADDNARLSQSFSETDADATSITLESWTFFIEKIASPTDDVTIEIQGDDGGSADGTAITNGTSDAIAGGTFGTAGIPHKFTWSTPPTLVSGTTYHVVFKRSTGTDGTNYYKVLDAGASTYAGGTAKKYKASTEVWTDLTVDFQSLAIFNKNYDGDVFKSDSDDIRRCKFVGFTESNESADAGVSVKVDAYIDGFSSLTKGASQYLSSTAGTLTESPSFNSNLISGAPLVHVGTAIKDDTILKDVQFSRLVDVASVFAPNGWIETGIGAATGRLDVFFDCGFTPREIEIRYKHSNIAADTNDDRYVITKFLRTTQMGQFYAKSSGFTTVTAISETELTGVIVQSIEENGAILRITQANSAETMDSLQVFFKG